MDPLEHGRGPQGLTQCERDERLERWYLPASELTGIALRPYEWEGFYLRDEGYAPSGNSLFTVRGPGEQIIATFEEAP
jgi:hypothetical protein